MVKGEQHANPAILSSAIFSRLRLECACALADNKVSGNANSSETNRMTLPPNLGIPNFVARAKKSMETAASSGRFVETRGNRIQRRYSLREISDLIGVPRSTIVSWLGSMPDAPEGVFKGRENTFSLRDVMKLRVMVATRAKAPRDVLHWRKPGEPLPVIAFSSQKGGTAKSLSAAHIAQMAASYYGLRVGIVDADPQGTISLYFADEETDVAQSETETFTRFMGLMDSSSPPVEHDAKTLDTYWQKTPWPGVRLMPGGAPITDADIGLFLLTQKEDKRDPRFHRRFKDTLDRWEASHPPRTAPEDFWDEGGNFLDDVFDRALVETLDLVIIDCAPTMTFTQLNAVLAATTLIVPNTLRGFDLSTLRVFLSSLDDFFYFAACQPDPVTFPDLPSYILPTNVQASNDVDLSQVGELYMHDPSVICPVYFGHSAAVANAALDYQSIYEYVPEKSRKRSADQFLANANAVGEAVLTRANPSLPPRGFANAFIKEHFGDMVPPWTDPVDDEDEEVA